MKVEVLLVMAISGDFLGVSCIDKMSLAFQYFSLRNATNVNVLLCNNADVRKVLTAQYAQYLPRDTTFLTNVKMSKLVRQDALPYVYLAQPRLIGVIVDLGCRRSWDVLQTISQFLLYNGSYAFALFTDQSIENNTTSLGSLKVAFDSDVVLFTGGMMYDIYRTSPYRPMIITAIGNWTKNGQMMLSSKPRRTDLQGITLRATTILQFFRKDLFGKDEFYDHNYETWRDVLGRFSSREHKLIEKLANFKFGFDSTFMNNRPRPFAEIRTALNSVYDWGYYNASASSHGFPKGTLFGMLGDNETDFGIVLSWMWSKRMSTAYFAPPTHRFRAPAFFRHPPAGISYDAFARPFTWRTWLVIWGFVVMGSGCIYFALHSVEKISPVSERTYDNCLFSIIGLLCLKRTLDGISKTSTRVIALFLQVLGLMVYSYYGATILGFLLTPSPRTITTLDKLLHSGMQFWMENSSSNRGLIKHKLSAQAVRYYETVIKGPTEDQDRVIDRIDGLKLVQRGGVVLYGLTPNLFQNIREMYSTPEICSLHYMTLLDFDGSTAIQKQSPYREMYTKATLWMLENGLNSYEDRHWYSEKPECIGSETNPAVRLEATFIAQIIYLVGFAISLIFFTWEKFLVARKRRSVNKQNLGGKGEMIFLRRDEGQKFVFLH